MKLSHRSMICLRNLIFRWSWQRIKYSTLAYVCIYGICRSIQNNPVGNIINWTRTQMWYNIMTKLFFNFEVVFVWTYDISQVKDGIFQNFTVIPGYARWFLKVWSCSLKGGISTLRNCFIIFILLSSEYLRT